MLHLLRFHCISGELKVVEGSDFRDTCDYYWHGNWQAPTGSGLYHHNGTTHSLLTTMVMSKSLLNFSVELGAVRLLMLYDCKLNGRLSSNVDGHVDNYLLILCSMPLSIIVRLVFNIKNPDMNKATCTYIV